MAVERRPWRRVKVTVLQAGCRTPARAQVLQQDAPGFVFWGLTVLEQAEVLSEAWVA